MTVAEDCLRCTGAMALHISKECNRIWKTTQQHQHTFSDELVQCGHQNKPTVLSKTSAVSRTSVVTASGNIKLDLQDTQREFCTHRSQISENRSVQDVLRVRSDRGPDREREYGHRNHHRRATRGCKTPQAAVTVCSHTGTVNHRIGVSRSRRAMSFDPFHD